MDKKTQGKKNKAAGARFELKVRKDLESKRWIVSKWMNNVEFGIIDETKRFDPKNIPTKGNVTITAEKGKEVIVRNERYDGKLIPAKHKFRGPGIPMAIGTGFPDFIAFRIIEDRSNCADDFCLKDNSFIQISADASICGVEVKSNGYLTKEEKEKCGWLIQNNIFSKILIASKGEKRGEIKYQEVKNNGKKDI